MIGASGGSGFFLLIIVAFAFLWLVLVRPQKKRQIAQQQMLNELQPGDEVVTAGGIYGTIRSIDGDDVMVRIAPDLDVKVARRAIGGVVLPPEPEESPQPGAGNDGGDAAVGRPKTGRRWRPGD
jgi:preprotein translocase subunit YajC